MDAIKIVGLNSAANIRGILLGTKAANLIQMARIGLPVPPGFCIPGTTCREHINAAGILLRLTTALPKLQNAQLDDKQKILADIRKRITDAPLDNGLNDRITNHYRALDNPVVAVRSSATAEDLPGKSFAGQYDTFLNVASVNECTRAVKKCWASLWTERAFDYRRQNAVDHLDAEMAVIVQQMVRADISGITFTADPLSGDTERIVIEAARGLGENVVQGRIAPDRYVLDKRHLTIVERISAVPNAPPCIDDNTAKRLAQLALKVESHFAAPQDIEWSIKDEQIWLLQARPVTTLSLSKQRAAKSRQIWSHFPAQEVMPDVVTSATKSILDAIADHLLQPIFDMLGIDRCGHPIFDYIAGRVYFNAALFIAAANALPGSARFDWSEVAGSDPDSNRLLEFARNTPAEDLPQIKFHKFRFFIKLPLLAARFLLAGSAKEEAFIADAIAGNKKAALARPCEMTTEQILTSYSTLADDFSRLCSGIVYLLNVFLAFPVLQFLCKRWFNDPARAGRLVAGLGRMTDAEAALDLWNLARKADDLPEIRDAILAEHLWTDIAATLDANTKAAPFCRAWDKFLSDHGHHCRAEIELFNPRWSEQPDYILSLIRGYLKSIDCTDPLKSHSKIAEDRRQLEIDCRRTLKNPIKRCLFNRILTRAQTGSVWRENMKSEMIKMIALLRGALLEIAKRLHADKTLDDPNDIFFLRLEEIPSVAQAHADFDIKQRIADRRAEHEKWSAISPPGTVIGTFVPEDYVPDPVQTDVETVKGLALSPGLATGKARVILKADTDQHLLAGEILVAPFTDPGWTPYFIPAAAVVTERGSLLSHGAIVARELGIPAVTNVGPVTRIIKTGQTIQIDGNTGTLKILK
ncbi:MAG: hypothetical protein JXN61_01540 [Sedimentisphaerales bacterium]|nr:hypothetical protein [Sedimentisphaerales bacterium]